MRIEEGKRLIELTLKGKNNGDVTIVWNEDAEVLTVVRERPANLAERRAERALGTLPGAKLTMAESVTITFSDGEPEVAVDRTLCEGD